MSYFVEQNPVIFSNLPHPKDLLTIVVSLDCKEKKDRSVKSDFQWQLLKTRLLIYDAKDVLASPAQYNLTYIHVVCTKVLHSGGGLSQLLLKHRLHVEAVSPLNMSIYQDCLLYCLTCRLSPDWNRIENNFVQGRYFLFQRPPLPAVRLQLSVFESQLAVHAEPRRLWLTPVDLLHFLDVKILEINGTQQTLSYKTTVSGQFYKDLSGSPEWVHVLPSFKRGRLMFICNYLPKESPFSNYTEMRKHWKNTYGYRLPEDGSTMFYAGINFFSSTNFTYPLECVRRGLHDNIGDPAWRTAFIASIQTRSGEICGHKLHLSTDVALLSQTYLPQEEANNCRWNEEDLLKLDPRIFDKFVNADRDPMSISQVSLVSANGLLTSSQEMDEMPSQEDLNGFVIGSLLGNSSSSQTTTRRRPPPGRKFCDSVLRRPVFLTDSDEVPRGSLYRSVAAASVSSVDSGLGSSSEPITPAPLPTPLKPVFIPKKKQTIKVKPELKSGASKDQLPGTKKPIFIPKKKCLISNIAENSKSETSKNQLPQGKTPVFISNKEILINNRPDSSNETPKNHLPVAKTSVFIPKKKRLVIAENSKSKTSKNQLPESKTPVFIPNKEILINNRPDSSNETPKNHLPVAKTPVFIPKKKRLGDRTDSLYVTPMNQQLESETPVFIPKKKRLIDAKPNSIIEKQNDRLPMTETPVFIPNKKCRNYRPDSKTVTTKKQLIEAEAPVLISKEKHLIDDKSDSKSETQNDHLMVTKTQVFVPNINHFINDRTDSKSRTPMNHLPAAKTPVINDRVAPVQMPTFKVEYNSPSCSTTLVDDNFQRTESKNEIPKNQIPSTKPPVDDIPGKPLELVYYEAIKPLPLGLNPSPSDHESTPQPHSKSYNITQNDLSKTIVNPGSLASSLPSQKKLEIDGNMNVLTPSTEKVKAVKKAPVLLDDVDIESRLKKGLLHKVTIPSLYDFLKRNGVPCTRQMKKEELLMKVQNFLTLKAST